MPDLVQPRDPLDVPALAAWLRETLGVEETPAVHQYAAGFSNLTYRLDAGDRTLVLRRPPLGAHVRGGHDMGREVRLLTALAGHVPVPDALAFEPTGDVLGAPFYVMEHVAGTILRSTDPEPLGAEAMARVAASLVGTLAELHALAPETVGLGDLGTPDGYVGRQVAGWTKRYLAAATDSVPDLDRAFAWMAEHQPPEAGAAVIHNDFKYDNLVLDPDTLGVRAILDWELATVGCPLMDLGSSLGYWVEPGDPPALRAAALSPTWWPGNPTREGLVAMYEAATGRTVLHAPFYTVYGLTKLAVIAQQIYQRWTLGTARDPRFGGLGHVVRACGEAAARIIDTGRISA